MGRRGRRGRKRREWMWKVRLGPLRRHFPQEMRSSEKAKVEVLHPVKEKRKEADRVAGGQAWRRGRPTGKGVEGW